MSLLLEMFTYPFILRAFVVGILVALCAALLGVPLVLKRYSMIGDGLSHVSFGALAIAVALGLTPLYFSIPVVILAAFFLLRMAGNPHWNSDAAIAAVSASALAVGILVISRTTGMTTDVDNYMFGSVLAMTRSDVALSVVLSAAPCMGSGARMFCAVPLAVTVGSSSGCACPCSRMAVMAKLTSRMPATAPANRMTPPGPPLRRRPVL